MHSFLRPTSFIRALAASPLMLSLATACIEPIPDGSPAPQAQTPPATTPATPSIPETGSPLFPGPHIGPVAALPICSPQPLGHKVPPLPAWPDHVLGSCGLVAIRHEPASNVAGRDVDVSRDGPTTSIVTTTADGGWQERINITTAEGADPANAEIIAVERITTTAYHGPPQHVRENWVHDGDGHLERYELETSHHTILMAFTYEDGRLLGHRFREQWTDGQPRDVKVQWHWQNGRLTHATQHVLPVDLVETVHYATDSEGRTRAISRQLGDAPHVVHHFDWEQDDALRGRRIDLDFAAFPDDTARDFLNQRVPFDDFEADVPWMGDYSQSRTWDTFGNPSPLPERFAEALWRVRNDGNCNLPPTQVGHAWPQREGAWELAFRDDDELDSGLGFAYGYWGYAYGYGDSAWFGHEGLGVESWPLTIDNLREHGAAEIAIRYDEQQRLVSESMRLEQGPGGFPARLERTRTYDPDVAGEVDGFGTLNVLGIARDTVHFSSDDPRMPPVTRTVGWSRDETAAGTRLTRYLDDDGTRVAFQTWRQIPAINGQNAFEHVVHVDREVSNPMPGLSITAPAVGNDPIVPTPFTMWQWAMDDAGFMTWRTLTLTSHQGDVASVQTTTWQRDTEGRPLERVVRESSGSGWRFVAAWDTAGRLVMQGSGPAEADAPLTMAMTWTHDDKGRVRAVTQVDAAGELREIRTYQCD